MTTDDAAKPGPTGIRRVPGSLWRAVVWAHRWFRIVRRTRPFWGALWTILGGLWIVQAMNFNIGLALTGGWSYAAGYVMGGGLILFGVVALVAPHYRTLCGLVAFLIALGAFPTANLGGYLLGSVLGIIGGSMIWAWGPKKPRRPRRSAEAASADEPGEVSSGDPTEAPE